MCVFEKWGCFLFFFTYLSGFCLAALTSAHLSTLKKIQEKDKNREKTNVSSVRD